MIEIRRLALTQLPHLRSSIRAVTATRRELVPRNFAVKGRTSLHLRNQNDLRNAR